MQSLSTQYAAAGPGARRRTAGRWPVARSELSTWFDLTSRTLDSRLPAWHLKAGTRGGQQVLCGVVQCVRLRGRHGSHGTRLYHDPSQSPGKNTRPFRTWSASICRTTIPRSFPALLGGRRQSATLGSFCPTQEAAHFGESVSLRLSQ